jgi:hypothetical protein
MRRKAVEKEKKYKSIKVYESRVELASSAFSSARADAERKKR